MSHRIALLTALCLIVSTSLLHARDLTVPGDATSLAAALDQAEPGDRVLLRPGRHAATLVDLVDGVTIVGNLDDPRSVVIDGGRRGRVLRAESLTWARLEGLTITGGAAEGVTSYESSGGGLFVSSSRVELKAVHFVDNRAQSAGGCLRVSNSEIEIEDGVFLSGHAAKGGGAIDLSYGSTAEIRGTVFRGNRAAWGGAISVRTSSSCWINDSHFIDNVAVAPRELGGAFFADHAAQVAFRGCVLRGNQARQGGGARVRGAMSAFIQCTFAGNEAYERGGSLMVEGGPLFLDHTILAFNQGSALLDSDVAVTVWATDIYGNLGGDWVGLLAPLCDADDNLAVDPLFCSDTDLHLQDESPCARQNNRVGLIGALDVGCSGVGVIQDSFGARQEGGRVVLTWQVLGTEDQEFHLVARDELGEEWSVDYAFDGLPGRYRAVDKPRRPSGTVQYSLEYRDLTCNWFLLGEVSVELDSSPVPEALAIEQIYPNPFNPQVTVRFSLGRPTRVEAAVYDLQGRMVMPLTAGLHEQGSHVLQWNGVSEHGRQAPAGTYILRIEAGDRVVTRKLVMVR